MDSAEEIINKYWWDYATDESAWTPVDEWETEDIVSLIQFLDAELQSRGQ